MKKINYLSACTGMGLLLHLLLSFNINAQSFTSPGQEACNTTSATLAARTATDGVTITGYRWVTASCLDENLFTISVNDCNRVPYTGMYPQCATNGTFLRRPTFCYNNGYFPTTSGFPLAIAQNMTANSGSCIGSAAHVVANFSTVKIRPKGLTFTINDIDNPYDSIKVLVYSNGSLASYDFAFGETDPANSYVWSEGVTGTTGSGTAVSFGSKIWGDANGWATLSTPNLNYTKGVINFTVDPTLYVDSVVVVHVMRDDRPDANPAFSIGGFAWAQHVALPVVFGAVNATLSGNGVLNVNWTTQSEVGFKSFDIEASTDGRQFIKLGSVASISAGGDSAMPLNYSFSKRMDETVGLFGLYFIALVALLVFAGTFAAQKGARRAGIIKVLSVISGLIFMGVLMVACNKKERTTKPGQTKLFIRIVTQDLNGAVNQSKVVQAVQQ